MARALIVMQLLFSTPVLAQSKISDFRATNQRVALVDWHVEFVEPSVNEGLLRDARRIINRYSKTYDQAAVSQFTLAQNSNNQYFKPVVSEMDAGQKEFLQRAAKDNQVDIFVLGNLRESSSGLDLEVQLYDVRIDTCSEVETVKFKLGERQFALEDVLWRSFNYLDRDGFVHPSAQDFLQKPVLIQQSAAESAVDSGELAEAFVAPEELSRGRLAGEISIGGEKTPFWERWWFWTLIVGGMATAGGLSYYFLVLNQPSSQAEITFNMPQ